MARVQAVSNQSTGTGTVTVTITAATAGNLLVCGGAVNEVSGGDVDLNTPTGFTATSLADTNATTKVRERMWWKKAAGGETSVIVAAASGTADVAAWVIEWSGISNPAEDLAAEATGSTSPALTGTIGTPAAGAVGIAIIAINNSNNLTTPTNSYTLEGTVLSSNATAANETRLALLYNASPGATNTQLTQGGTARSYVGQLVTFKAGGTNATATPSTVAAVAAVPAPTVKTGSTVTPSTVVAVAAVPAPIVKTGSTVFPATVVAVAAVPAVTVTTGGGTDATATPATVVAVAAVPSVAIIATGADPNPAPGWSRIPRRKRHRDLYWS